MSIRIDDLKLGDPEQRTPTGTVQVIVKVRNAGYVPPAVTIRARIDEHIFTADVPAGELPQLESNPQVVSIAANKKLRIIE
ncbi:MAG: hypothetical protein H0T47_16910 [Planctomycetaceae bacterium]|nr:hypothetical protein [Planctomycetaceae bacterium]